MKGLEFKTIREELGLTQEELSEILCLSGKKVVSNIEREVRNPSLLTVVLMRLLAGLSQKKSKELQSLLISFYHKEIDPKGRKS